MVQGEVLSHRKGTDVEKQSREVVEGIMMSEMGFAL